MRHGRQHPLAKYMEPALIAWAIYLLLIPLYVFKSGLPQPGDMFVVILVPVALRSWNGRLPLTALPITRSLLLFTLWVCVVDYAWALISRNFGLFGVDTFVLFPLYYIYNGLLFLVGIVLYQRFGETFLRLTLYAISFTVAVLVLASFVYRTGSRGSIFFNNPNQLGYFALLAACVIVLLHWRLRLNLIVTSVMLASCGYLSALSASRSALGGIAILLALLVFSNPRVIIGVAIAAVLLLFVGGPVADAVDAAENRVRNRRSNTGFLEERGYDRIWEHQEYLLFGAGEGGLSRFDEDRKVRMEIHSSAGTVLFSYGIVGATLFLVFMLRVMRRAGWRLMIVLVPPLAYAVAHQGLRFTLLWVLLAIFVMLKHERAGARARPAAVARTPDQRLIRST